MIRAHLLQAEIQGFQEINGGYKLLVREVIGHWSKTLEAFDDRSFDSRKFNIVFWFLQDTLQILILLRNHVDVLSYVLGMLDLVLVYLLQKFFVGFRHLVQRQVFIMVWVLGIKLACD